MPTSLIIALSLSLFPEPVYQDFGVDRWPDRGDDFPALGGLTG